MAARLRDERGSILPLIPVLIFGLLLLGGLVIDGGRDLNARSQAQSYAEEAARAGATAIDRTSATLRVIDQIAADRVTSYCNNVRNDSHSHVTDCYPVGVTDIKVTCNGTTLSEHILVRAHVELKVNTLLLGIVGHSTMTAKAEAVARPYEGVVAADSC